MQVKIYCTRSRFNTFLSSEEPCYGSLTRKGRKEDLGSPPQEINAFIVRQTIVLARSIVSLSFRYHRADKLGDHVEHPSRYIISIDFCLSFSKAPFEHLLLKGGGEKGMRRALISVQEALGWQRDALRDAAVKIRWPLSHRDSTRISLLFFPFLSFLPSPRFLSVLREVIESSDIWKKIFRITFFERIEFAEENITLITIRENSKSLLFLLFILSSHPLLVFSSLSFCKIESDIWKKLELTFL